MRIIRDADDTERRRRKLLVTATVGKDHDLVVEVRPLRTVDAGRVTGLALGESGGS